MTLDELTHKVENDGATSEGRLTAEEYNTLLDAVKENRDNTTTAHIEGIVQGYTASEVTAGVANPVSSDGVAEALENAGGEFQEKLAELESEVKKSVVQIFENKVSFKSPEFNINAGQTIFLRDWYFRAERGDTMTFVVNGSTSSEVGIGASTETGNHLLSYVAVGEEKTIVATFPISTIYIYMTRTGSADKLSVNATIKKASFVPSVKKVLFSGIIEFNSNNVLIPIGRLVYENNSILTEEVSLDITNLTNRANYSLIYNFITRKWLIERTSSLSNFLTNDMIVIASWDKGVYNKVYGVDTYKIDGELFSPKSDADVKNLVFNETAPRINQFDKFNLGVYIGTASVGSNFSPTYNSETKVWMSCKLEVNEGDAFDLTGTGGVNSRLYIIVDENENVLEIADSGASFTEKKIIIQQKGYLYINIDLSLPYSLYKYENIESFIARREDELFNNERLGNYTFYNEFAYAGNKIVQIPCSLTKGYSYEVILDAAGSGYQITLETLKADGTREWVVNIQKALGVSRYVYVAEENRSGLALYFSTNAPSGNGCIKIISSATDAERKEDDKFISQFGLTCNCNYKVDAVDALELPSSNICDYFYGLYDSLVSRFPTYVTKVDCDNVMQSLGVERPSYLSDKPIFMYKFIPAYTPKLSDVDSNVTAARKIKVFIVTGVHSEYMAMWDLYQSMRLICEKWETDSNLEELRWNCEWYIIPCSNPYGIDNNQRTNYNGVDLNRNAPSDGWKVQGQLGDNTYSGPEAGSEYETKLFVHFMNDIQPNIFVDHHNTNTGSGDFLGDNKNLGYASSSIASGVDIAAAHFSQITRKFKARSQTSDALFSGIFPSNEADATTIFGFAYYSNLEGTREACACDNGIFGFTYESNSGILYKNGVLSAANRQVNTALVSTCATEGFINFMLRALCSL